MKGINLFFYYIYKSCKNLLTLYTHSPSVDLNEHVRKILGNILVKNGYIKDIAKLINVFLKINI